MSDESDISASSTNLRAVLMPGLQDIEQVRLVLRGDSVIDWHRLAFRDLSHVDEFLVRLGFDPTNADEMRRLREIHQRALRYLERHFGRRLPPAVARPKDIRDLFLMASRSSAERADACMVLKVMHIVHHADGRELLYRLPVPINELFHRIETQVFTAIDGMKGEGIRVAEFAASRKTEASIITKLLARAESVAADVHDRLRFRVITEGLDDLFAAVLYLTRRLLPFNYVVPGESRNDLIDLVGTLEGDPRLRSLSGLLQTLGNQPDVPVNTFSSAGFRVINFVVDMTVRVDDLLEAHPEIPDGLGSVVFLLVEFQLVDRETHLRNSTGQNRHELYKARQREQVLKRLTGRG